VVAQSIFGRRWVHVGDEGGLAVFEPWGPDNPPSRRPRTTFELADDMSARVYVGTADDRSAAKPARWHQDGEIIVIAAAADVLPGELRIMNAEPDRLLVQM
jgi:hypothetical protein